MHHVVLAAVCSSRRLLKQRLADQLFLLAHDLCLERLPVGSADACSSVARAFVACQARLEDRRAQSSRKVAATAAKTAITCLQEPSQGGKV